VEIADQVVSPLLKWAGGKRQIADVLASFLPTDWRSGQYYEPFMGGGAMFLHLKVARIRSLAERGGWRCGYCGIRVTESRVLRKAQRLLGKPVFPSRTSSGSIRDYHVVWLLTALTLDHIKPLSMSGDDSDCNLVAACWASNVGKYHYTLEQLNIRWPQQRNSSKNGWRGLTQWL